MNNDNKIVDQNPGTPQAPIQPVPGVGGANKEAVRPVVAPVSEFVRPSGAEITPNIPPEVSSADVKLQSDRPDLTSEHTQIGLVHSPETVAVPTAPSGLVKIPQTGDARDSDTWLNTLTEKVEKVLRLLGV